MMSYTSCEHVYNIKTKKTLKYLSVCQLRVGSTHLVWQSKETVAAVRKAVINAGFLTGVVSLTERLRINTTRTRTHLLRSSAKNVNIVGRKKMIGKNKELSSEFKELIVESYKSNKNKSELARIVGIPRRTIGSVI